MPSNHPPAPAAPLARRDGMRDQAFRTLFSPLAGMSPGDWWRLLRDHDFDVDARYLGRAAFVTAHALASAPLGALDRWWFGARVQRAAVSRPIFVLGHWRSGTTWLQQLLAADPRLHTPTFLEVLYPHAAIAGARPLAPLVGAFLPRQRPTDRMPLHIHGPMEDEFALAVLTGRSPYLGWTFPRHHARHEPWLTLREVDEAQRRAWKQALRDFAARLTVAHGRTLVFKSPPHTARVRWLLEVFPDARFVHIHRHPHAVYRSTMRLALDGVDGLRLQHAARQTTHQRVVDRYRVLHDAWFEDRPLIPDGQLHELAYADLIADPERSLARLYDALDLGDPAPAAGAWASTLGAARGYQRTAFPPLSDALREELAHAWSRSFDAWGYERLDHVA